MSKRIEKLPTKKRPDFTDPFELHELVVLLYRQQAVMEAKFNEVIEAVNSLLDQTNKV